MKKEFDNIDPAVRDCWKEGKFSVKNFAWALGQMAEGWLETCRGHLEDASYPSPQVEKTVKIRGGRFYGD